MMHEYSREEVFSKIHKALRKELFELSVLAGRTDFSNPNEIQILLNRLTFVESILLDHAEKEDTVVFPMLEEKQPGCTKQLSDDHHVIHERLATLITELRSIAGTPAPRTLDLEFQWYLDLNRFTADYLLHMNVEENETAALIRSILSLEEMQQLTGRIVAAIAPEMLAMMFKSMLPAMHIPERVAFMSGVRLMAPAPAFEGFMGVAKTVLTEPEFAHLEGAMKQ